MDAAAEIQHRFEALAKYNESRVAEGVAAEGDLIRIQVEVERAATATTLEEVELIRARAALLPFLGDGSEAPPAIASLSVAIEDSVAVRDSLAPLEQFVTLAGAQRPDLLAARARVAAARAEVSLQRTMLVRELGLVFGTKRLSGFTTLIAGVTLPLPLFEQNRGGRAIANGARAAAEAELHWSERLAHADVEAAYRSAELLTRQAARLRGSLLERADESRRITLAAYEEGAAPLLQVLDVSRAWSDARLLYYRTLFAQRQSLLELSLAAGLDPDAGMPASLPGSSGPTPTHSGDSP
jgi:outer membrane protein, heavy metal efflux system